MHRKLLWGLSGLGLTATLAGGADWLRRTEIRPYCHLPAYDYRPIRPENPTSAVSTIAITSSVTSRAERPAEPGQPASTITTRTKTFQLATASLQNNHCRLDRIALIIAEDGTWALSFRAQQNPSLVPEQERPQYERFLHNQLLVAVRGVGLFPLGESPDTTVLGKPEFFKICLAPFLVHKREERILRWTGHSQEIAETFDAINRIEVDLRYQ